MIPAAKAGTAYRAFIRTIVREGFAVRQGTGKGVPGAGDVKSRDARGRSPRAAVFALTAAELPQNRESPAAPERQHRSRAPAWHDRNRHRGARERRSAPAGDTYAGKGGAR
ncbi:hypothetical protein GCM10009642_50990 [Nocardiopsis metallicus]